MPELPDIRAALQAFGGDPQQAQTLASVLGFTPIPAPVDLLASRRTPLGQFFARTDRFGVGGLYQVGTLAVDSASAGLYVAVLDGWGHRSADRDRARRRVARALVELSQTARPLFVMVPNARRPDRARREAEFVLIRAGPRSGQETRGTLTTIRALVDLQQPTHFHLALLADIAIRLGSSILAISQQWQRAFSVERVSKRFYQEYMKLRNDLADALRDANPDRAIVRDLGEGDRRAWATRQLGRILFLWFLQSKRWLGDDRDNDNAPPYLLDLWQRRGEAAGGYYRGILVPLFFEAMAERRPSQRVRDLLGETPYLNGGLFRRNPLENRIRTGGEVTLPDELFDPRSESSVLGLLRRYRFTTQESTPDDQSVDPDPELLGRVFENLYQGDQRHDSGTYYTPREIVHFMCRQALDGYLRDTVGVDQETLERLRREVVEPDPDDRRLEPTTADTLVEALANVRVCDPAAGSGAFLLGMMQEIVQLRRGIVHAQGNHQGATSDDIAKWKRHAIQRSLHGVDINPEAVEICQLRLWLSLVLDMPDVHDVEPLPNLDFRIVAGDSLIDRVGDIVFSESLLVRGEYEHQLPLDTGRRVEYEERNIERWGREFEATQDKPQQLQDLRDKITQAYNRIVSYHIEPVLKKAREQALAAEELISMADTDRQRKRFARGAALARQRVDYLDRLLGSITPNAPYQKPFLWPVAFREVFQQGGFDIVLANPPYVRQERLDLADQESYRRAFPQVYEGTADILVFFYARAIQILRDGGWLAFITSNSFVKRNYGAKLQQSLADSLRIQSVIDFGEVSIFEATVEPYVLVGKKAPADTDSRVLAHNLYPLIARRTGRNASVETVREELQHLEGFLAEEGCVLPQARFARSGWRIEDQAVLDLFDRLMAQGTPLGKFVGGRIYRGVLTGLNEAFVIDQAKRDELVAADPRSAELLKPWLRGRDIKRWRAEWSGRYIIAIQNSGDADAANPWATTPTEAEARGILRETYPAIHDHLSRFEDRLRPRADQGRFWWELRACTYYREFERPKIVWASISRSVRFALDESAMLANDKCNIWASPPPWVLPLLNSRLAAFLMYQLTNTLPGGFMELKQSYIHGFPIVIPSQQQEQALFAAAEQELVANNVSDSELNVLISDLYGLDRDEQALIDCWFERRSLVNQAVAEPETEDD